MAANSRDVSKPEPAHPLDVSQGGGPPFQLNGFVRDGFTLAELKAAIDRLAAGDWLDFEQADYARLFGPNLVGLARFLNFAEGHKCIVIHTIPSGGMILRKRSSPRVSTARMA
jgi:hypothetical protein